ncbi:MAG: LiaF transmembrane domain-containing protein [Mucilaginibacter sp.]
METIINNPDKFNGKVMAGIIIIIVGGILLIDNLNLFFVPDWLISWPMFLVAYGLYLGGKHNFRKPIWAWLVIIGTAFLFTENIDNADRVVWPLAIIAAGAWMVMRHNKRADAQYQDNNFQKM